MTSNVMANAKTPSVNASSLPLEMKASAFGDLANFDIDGGPNTPRSSGKSYAKKRQLCRLLLVQVGKLEEDHKRSRASRSTTALTMANGSRLHDAQRLAIEKEVRPGSAYGFCVGAVTGASVLGWLAFGAAFWPPEL
jgi:hypothetical protein